MKPQKTQFFSREPLLKKGINFILVVALLLEASGPAFAMMEENKEEGNSGFSPFKRSALISPKPRIPSPPRRPIDPLRNNSSPPFMSTHTTLQQEEAPVLDLTSPLSLPRSPFLQAGLEVLKKQIIDATGAEEDVYDEAKRLLKKTLSSFDSLSQETYDNLLPPEALLKFQKEKLLVEGPLKEQHESFRPIHKMLERLRELHSHSSAVALKAVLKKVEQTYEQFLTQFCRSFLEDRKIALESRAILKGEGIGRYFISASLARELLSKDLCGNKKKTDQEGGISTVVSKGSVHFKDGQSAINGINPSMEWSAYALSTLLWGQGSIPPSATLILEDIPFFKLHSKKRDTLEGENAKKFFNEKVIYPAQPLSLNEFFGDYPNYHDYFEWEKANAFLQASLTSGDASLFDFFKKVRQGEALFEDLDLPSYSRMVILSLLAGFTDAKDDNLRLEGRKLISIDNDRLFGNMIVEVSPQEHLIETKNVLFLLPSLMKKGIDPPLKDKIQTIDPDLLVLEWLWACSQQNERYKQLYHLSSLPEGCSPSLIAFKEKTGLNMKERLREIQGALNQEKGLTHQGLFYKLFPLASQAYGHLGESHKDPHQAQEDLWKDAILELVAYFTKVLKVDFSNC